MKPFSELRKHAGNAALFHATQLSLLGAIRGVPLHLHAQGVRGTGKTTLLRAAATLLPPIIRIKGCLYNCDPGAAHCPQHRSAPGDAALGRTAEVETERVLGPFRELSHSTKVATAVGSLDLTRLVGVADPAAALLPGLIPQSHRGILFIDEINRLADTAPELTDILLDVMGTKPGRLQVEEAGLPAVTVPTSATVWAASNPDEDPGSLSDIRRQLSDRFDLVVTVERPREQEVVQEIVASLIHGRSRAAGSETVENQQYLSNLRASLARAASLADRVTLPEPVNAAIAALYCRLELESLRAAEGLAVAALYHCALRGGLVVERRDVAAVLPLVLAHRLEPERLRTALEDFSRADENKTAVQHGLGVSVGRLFSTRQEGEVLGLRPARRLLGPDRADLCRPEDDLR